MNTKKVSLKDIALRAGVSTALVSYVLNGREKETRVGREIAKKIKEIAKDLDYQPNHLAKSLRSGKSHTIGLIIADISNPFFANISRIVEDEAKKNGWDFQTACEEGKKFNAKIGPESLYRPFFEEYVSRKNNN